MMTGAVGRRSDVLWTSCATLDDDVMVDSEGAKSRQLGRGQCHIRTIFQFQWCGLGAFRSTPLRRDKEKLQKRLKLNLNNNQTVSYA